jgi:hypothetical protein
VKRLNLKKRFVIVPALALTALMGGTALAALTASAGGAQLQIQNRANDLPSTTSSTVFNDLPGASVIVSVPAGRTQLINARFTAETICSRAVPALGGSCSVRIAATRLPGGPTVGLNPNSGNDYAIDSVRGLDAAEGHAMERSLRLGPGAYLVRVQRAVTSPAISFRLDDWHLAVQKSV